MTTARLAEPARSQVHESLTDAKRKAAAVRTPAIGGHHALLGLQRAAGNSAVNALMLAKRRSPGEQTGASMDAALREIRLAEPSIDTIEDGLKAAKATGIPVDLEGQKPPPSALAVIRTGFGPASVPAKKPVPPAKPVAKSSSLGKAGAATAGSGKASGAGKRAAIGKASEPALGGGGRTTGEVASEPQSADVVMMPPVSPVAVRPDDDPAFTAVKRNVTGFANAKRAHPSAASKAKEAQDAAVAPAGDVDAQAKVAKADTIDAQQAGAFDKKAFITAVKTAIEAKAPKTFKEADDYKGSGKAAEVKGDVKGLVTSGKEGQTKDIEAATAAPPDQSKAVSRPVEPMAPEQPGPSVPIPAAGAVPKPAPAEQTNFAAGTHAANQELADADVTEPQLAQSGEPEFTQALADKQAAATHADTAPAEFRQQEAQVIQQGRTEASAETATGVAGMQGSQGGALATLVADKGKTKTKDEAKRAEVTTKITGLFDAAEADVTKILDGIDPKVEKAFDTGEARARAAFENYVGFKMSAYKKDRYGGMLGGYRWAKDKLVGMPTTVNEFYEAGRELYLQQMNGVISQVADIVGSDLAAAKNRIATGKAEIAAYVKSLPPDLEKVGAEASTEIGERFTELESEVDAKQASVVDTLATKYVEARSGLDEKIVGMQAENKGLVDKVIGAIKAVVGTIRQLAGLLTSALARAANVVGDIIKKPVNFLMNLIAGVKGGILKFKDTIVYHLRKGLMGWLFGALAEGGVELPDTFDVKGIIKLLASIFGLTWANIRNRLVKKIGQKAMSAAEKGVEIFQVISSEGVGGLWRLLMEKLGNIKEMILEKVKDFVVTKIIVAGVTWLIGLLNPAAGFIKACKLIYDIVMFFVHNAARLAKFVNTIIDSVADMVRGNVSAVVNKINDTLGQMVPLIIGFFASAIGLGGIGRKIREIITRLQKPVNKALDSIISTGLKLAGPLIRGFKRVSGKVKAKVAAGKAWVKGKAAGAVSAVRDWLSVRKKFTAADGDHALFWKSSGSGATLTVATTPTPVTAVLARAASIISETHPKYEELIAAQNQHEKVLALKTTVEQQGPAGRQSVDVEALNNAMEALTPLLIPIVPIVFPSTEPAPAPAGTVTLPEWVQPFTLVKLRKRNVVARVLSIDTTNASLPFVRYQILRERSKPDDTFRSPDKGPTGAPEAVTAGVVHSDWAEFIEKPRSLYMGPNPSLTGSVGLQVQARMRAEGKLVGNEVRYGRDAGGKALPAGKFTSWSLSVCAMGHVIDAVTWWNTNGRFTGPQSAEVAQFMTDPDNYEIEPSGPNSLRGSQLANRGVRYLPSAK